jgi:hypothetical protein
MNLKQPFAGIAATALVIVISLLFISLFSFDMFSGWVSFVLICVIPMEIVMGVTWGAKLPAWAGSRAQPARGILLVLLNLGVGAVVAVITFYAIGGAVGPPTPMLMMCTIVSVIVMFWMAIMFGGYPFTSLIKNQVAAGVALLVACYVVNYLLFRLLFSYEFMKGAPVYVASLDPHGMFNAWYVLVFYMSVLGVMFLVINFDLWPFHKVPALMQQPVLGLVWTIVALVIGGGVFYIAVYGLQMDPVAYFARGPVPFIFGTIVVQNMMQGSLFAKHKQPVKGVLNTITVVVVGEALAWMFRALAPVVTGNVAPGPPGYDAERWLASALLGVTFPCLIFNAEFFKLWPVKQAD